MQLEKAGTESATSMNFLFILVLQFRSTDAILCFRFSKFHTDSRHGLFSGWLQ